MSKGGFLKVVVVGLFLYAFVAPGLVLAQSAAPAGGPPPLIAAPAPAVDAAPPAIEAPSVASSGRRARQATDIFAGLTYTDEQKAKIDQIRETTKAHMDTVIRDDKLSVDQKQAMLQGYQRIEAGQIFEILTPAQQRDVRKKLTTQRSAERQPQKPQPQPPVAPH